MEITEVRIKLMDDAGDRLKAFCSITLDDSFVIRDLKIIEGSSGPFVAMPSRKLTTRCPQCGCKNHLKAAYCNDCGLRLKDDRAIRDENGRTKLYADIAHPINQRCRDRMQERVVQAFHEELERAKLPGYVPSYDDFDHDDDISSVHEPQREAAGGHHRPPAPHIAPESRGAPQREQPRGPHNPPSHQRHGARRNDDSFGAGIL